MQIRDEAHRFAIKYNKLYFLIKYNKLYFLIKYNKMYIQYFFIFFITVFRITNSFEFSYSKFNSLLHEK